jgi:transposase
VLTPDEVREAHAMRDKGWSISVISRHLRRDRKTIRAYLTGQREPGHRRDHPARADPIAPYLEYCTTRLTDDPHLAATILYTELTALGYHRDYRTFTRTLRELKLRPECPECAAAKDQRLASSRSKRAPQAPPDSAAPDS